MSEAVIGEYCRKKGLHATQLDAWRAACEQANDWDQGASARERAATKASDKTLKQVQRERDRMEKALAEAAALLVMREKLQALRSKDEDD